MALAGRVAFAPTIDATHVCAVWGEPHGLELVGCREPSAASPEPLGYGHLELVGSGQPLHAQQG